MNAHHEHEFEAAPGLPESLPAGEFILWQGAPDWRVLAVQALHVRKLTYYFAAMLGLQALYLMGEPGVALLRPLLISLGMALLALGLLSATAWFAASSTLYTLTNKRMVMRLGIVLTVTFNLPLAKIASQLMAGRTLLESVQLGDIPGVGMVMIDGIVRAGRSRNTPPAQEVPMVVSNGH